MKTFVAIFISLTSALSLAKSIAPGSGVVCTGFDKNFNKPFTLEFVMTRGGLTGFSYGYIGSSKDQKTWQDEGTFSENSFRFNMVTCPNPRYVNYTCTKKSEDGGFGKPVVEGPVVVDFEKRTATFKGQKLECSISNNPNSTPPKDFGLPVVPWTPKAESTR
jgi:hypothetical protein